MMFPLFMPMLIGAGIGGLLNKKDPLKGALLGAGLGATGGAVAPGLLGGSAAAGSVGAAGATGAASSASMASSLPAFNPITGAYVNASSLPGMTGLLETAKGAGMAAKPYMEAFGTAKQAADMVTPQEAPPPMPVQLSTQPLDLSPILNQNQQEMARTFEEDMKRRQSMGEFARYAMGAR